MAIVTFFHYTQKMRKVKKKYEEMLLFEKLKFSHVGKKI